MRATSVGSPGAPLRHPIATFSMSGLLVAAGAAGLAYSGRIWIELLVQHRYEVDWVDRIFYAMIPVCGYALVAASGVLLFVEWAASSDVIAAGSMTRFSPDSAMPGT